MSNIDSLVRRLRARVLESAQRERSLDWISADALEKLQAQNASLQDERDALARERDKRVKAEKLEAEKPQTKPIGDTAVKGERNPQEQPPSSMQRALNLKEAAMLLGVSYSTVYAHRKSLGFFQLGNQWRVWPEMLREMTERGATAESPSAPKPARASVAKPSPSRDLPNSARAAAAAKELDELLAQPARKRAAKA